MKNTGYDHYGTIIDKRAAGYEKTPDGYRNAPYLDMSIPYSAGSMFSTVEDLYLWDQALYTDRVVSAQTKELMFKPGLDEYAYGWVVTKAKLGTGSETAPAIKHGGGINGFSTMIVRYPVQKNLIVLLDNTALGSNAIEQALTNILHSQPFEMPKMPLAEAMLKLTEQNGVGTAIALYRALKTTHANVYDFSEPELNRLGYQLLALKKFKEAVEIFKLNVAEYPQGFNTYDSLGEAYMESGNTELAIQNYKKSLELNPQNAGATAMLARLENKTVSVDIKTYDAYVGEYEINPRFKVAVFKEGDKLMTQATNQPAFELYPETTDKFFLKVVAAKVTFTRDDKGVVTGLIIHQNGRDGAAKKVK